VNKKEIIDLTTFENEYDNTFKADKILSENENILIKFTMAAELQAIGLSKKAISRQLNINYQRSRH